MPETLLNQLRQYTVVVADTGDIEAMESFRPQDATTNPSLITAAAQMPQYQPIVDAVLLDAYKELGAGASDAAVANLAFQRLAIAFGRRILAIVPGRVSTEVDARLSYDTDATIKQARAIIAQYDHAGIGRDRVLIKIASTWEGIRAAEVLERDGIHCNLTLLFGVSGASAPAMDDASGAGDFDGVRRGITVVSNDGKASCDGRCGVTSPACPFVAGIALPSLESAFSVTEGMEPFLSAAGATHETALPPLTPEHVHVQGPLPLTEPLTPAEHRPACGLVRVGTPPASPQAPSSGAGGCNGAVQLTVMPPFNPNNSSSTAHCRQPASAIPMRTGLRSARPQRQIRWRRRTGRRLQEPEPWAPRFFG